MIRPLLAVSAFALCACTFGGGGIAPFTPAPSAAISEADLEVPYVPTPQPVVEAMLDLAQVGSEDYLIDLGSGDGRIAIAAARRGARALGVDIDSDRVAQAEAAAQLAQVQTQVHFRRQDLFDTPIGEASVVTLYLLPEINMRLRPRLLTELRPGTRIVSHNFTLGDWRPDAQREIGASHIYSWTVPAPVAGRWALIEGAGEPVILDLDQHFQEVTGSGTTLLRSAELRGTHLSFTIDTAAGPRRYNGHVEGAEIIPDDPDAGWRARRLD